MTEHGIFNDEGLLEGSLYSPKEIQDALSRYSEDEVHLAEICPDHPEQEAKFCEECNSEE